MVGTHDTREKNDFVLPIQLPTYLSRPGVRFIRPCYIVEHLSTGMVGQTRLFPVDASSWQSHPERQSFPRSEIEKARVTSAIKRSVGTFAVSAFIMITLRSSVRSLAHSFCLPLAQIISCICDKLTFSPTQYTVRC